MARRVGEKWKLIGLGFLAALTLSVVCYVLLAPSPPPPAPTAVTEPKTRAGAAITPSPKPARVPLAMHEGSRVLFFGDSWTLGTSAHPATRGFAYIAAETLRLDATIDGVGGTGYLNKGPGSTGNYGDRLNELDSSLDPDIVIIQGSVNDMTQPANALQATAQTTIKAFGERFPAAQVIVVGPAPDKAPGLAPGIGNMDVMLANAAFDAGARYISPWRDQWITEQNVSQIIDPETVHPSTAGHAILAERLVESLRDLAAAKALTG